MDLYHHSFLPGVPVPYFGYPVSGTPNFEENFSLHVTLRGSDHQLSVLSITSGSTSEVGLMLFPLRMRKVRPFIGVKCQAETTF